MRRGRYASSSGSGGGVMARVRSAARTDAGLGLDGTSHAVDQQGHLVAHLADVGLLGREHGEVGPVTDAHEHQEAHLHLDDGLHHRAALEEAGGADREAGQTGGDGRDLLGALARDAGARGHEETVGGHEDRVRRVGYVVDESRHHPVEVSVVTSRAGDGGGGGVVSHAGPASVCWVELWAARRPRETPAVWDWRRRRIASGSRVLAAVGGVTLPGTRRSPGARRGSPVTVDWATATSSTCSAISHPRSTS